MAANLPSRLSTGISITAWQLGQAPFLPAAEAGALIGDWHDLQRNSICEEGEFTARLLNRTNEMIRMDATLFYSPTVIKVEPELHDLP